MATKTTLTAEEAKRLAKEKDLRVILDEIKAAALAGDFVIYRSGGMTELIRQALKNLGYKVIPEENGVRISWS